MNIILNSKTVKLPSGNMTVSDLLKWQCISFNGTAVSINNRIVCHSNWDLTYIEDNDNVVIISAAFGG